MTTVVQEAEHECTPRNRWPCAEFRQCIVGTETEPHRGISSTPAVAFPPCKVFPHSPVPRYEWNNLRMRHCLTDVDIPCDE